MGKIVYVASDLAAICAEQIDAVSFAERQVISERTPVRVDCSGSQAKLNLEVEPTGSSWLPTYGWPAFGRVGVFHGPDVIH